MPTRRLYSGNAVATRITGSITSAATTITIDDATGWPAGPAYAVINRGGSTQEVILYASRSGANLNSVTRGQADTVASSHSAETIEHVATKVDFDEANSHTSDDEADPHATKLLNNTRHDLAARHAFGSALTRGTAQALGDTGNGSTSTVADGAHTHGFPAATTYTPVWSSDLTPQPSVGSGTLVGRYIKVGKLLIVSIELSSGGSTSYGNGGWRFSLPSGMKVQNAVTRYNPAHVVFNSQVVPANSWPLVDAGATDLMKLFSATPSTPVMGTVGSAHPGSWTSAYIGINAIVELL